MHSHVVLLLLALTVVLVNAKNVRQINDENNGYEEQTKIFHPNHNIHQLPSLEEILLKILANGKNNQQENDRFEFIAKRAKAIVKGDPREFMG